MFQFQYGAIKSGIPKADGFISFNSNMVRLKEGSEYLR